MRELFREFVVAKDRMRHEFERDTRIGYQAVRVYLQTMNQKHMPKFESLMPGHVNGGPTLVEQRTRFEALSAHIGVPIKAVKPSEESKN